MTAGLAYTPNMVYIFKNKIKCIRIYGKTPEVFWVKNGGPSLRKENLADDFARFFYDEKKVLEWYYKNRLSRNGRHSAIPFIRQPGLGRRIH
jgi:hypothetical protein